MLTFTTSPTVLSLTPLSEPMKSQWKLLFTGKKWPSFSSIIGQISPVEFGNLQLVFIQHVFFPLLAILLCLDAPIQQWKYSPQEKPYNYSVKDLLNPGKVQCYRRTDALSPEKVIIVVSPCPHSFGVARVHERDERQADVVVQAAKLAVLPG